MTTDPIMHQRNCPCLKMNTLRLGFILDYKLQALTCTMSLTKLIRGRTPYPVMFPSSGFSHEISLEAAPPNKDVQPSYKVKA